MTFSGNSEYPDTTLSFLFLDKSNPQKKNINKIVLMAIITSWGFQIHFFFNYIYLASFLHG